MRAAGSRDMRVGHGGSDTGVVIFQKPFPMAIESDWSDVIDRFKAKKGRRSRDSGNWVRERAANRDRNKNNGALVRSLRILKLAVWEYIASD